MIYHAGCRRAVVPLWWPITSHPSFHPPRSPPRVADLLLSAIAIDTGNFKPISEDGKATEADMTPNSGSYVGPLCSNTTTSSLSDPGTGFKDFYKQLAKIQKMSPVSPPLSFFYVITSSRMSMDGRSGSVRYQHLRSLGRGEE
ncbi:hypothetical protein H4Q26_013070 [Puccinia striiformis f. sp. tritici PST-130]|nr:hypothetical protein H4Q26_013070 [Puccinia striiformis f. sp. tritici PST-130]